VDWFEVFLGMLARDKWRERQEQKRLNRAWVDQQVAVDEAKVAEWQAFETAVLEVLEKDFQRTLAVTDDLVARMDYDPTAVTRWTEQWSAWCRRSRPTLERLAERCRALEVPFASIEPGTINGWIEVKFDAAAALDRVIEGCRLGQERDWTVAGPVVQNGMDMWSAMFEKLLRLGSPASQRAWKRRYERAVAAGEARRD
jgi:hypothetical protein